MQNDNNLLIISESAYFPEDIRILKEEKSKYDDTWTVTFETILQKLDVPNQNNRVYTTRLFKEIWDSQIVPKLKKRHLYGELGHPIEGYSNPEDALARQITIHPPYMSHMILDMKLDGQYIRGTVKTLSTPYGQIATRILTIDKGTLGFSLRAVGKPVPQVLNGRKVYVIQKPFIFVTYDMVVNPSNPATIFDYTQNKNLSETAILKETRTLTSSRGQSKVICLDNICVINENINNLFKHEYLKQLFESAIEKL